MTKHVPCTIVGQRGPSMLRSTRLTRGRHSSAEIWRAAWWSTLLSTLLYVSACLQPSFDLIIVIMSETDRVVFHARYADENVRFEDGHHSSVSLFAGLFQG